MPVASPQDFAVDVVEVQLPSQKGTDKTVLLQRPDLINLISAGGEIPDILTSMMMSLMNEQKQVNVSITAENLPKIMQSMDVIAIAAFHSPKLWRKDHAEGEYMPVAWLKFNDKAWVFSWALGAEYQPLENFRDQQADGVGAIPEGDHLSGESERPSKR